MSNIGVYGNLNEDEIDELFEKSIMLPTRYDIHEYEMMEEFAKTIAINWCKENNIKFE